MAEPILYSHSELSWGTADGKQDVGSLVPKCPVALASDDSCAPCRVIRSGTDSRHGIIGLGYPERVSGIPRFRCREHKRNFSLLTPTVYEALPDGAVVQPELVVLTEDTIFRKEAWRVLGMKVFYCSGCLAVFVRNVLLILQPIHLVECSGLFYVAGLGLRGRLCQGGFGDSAAGPEHIQLMASVVHLLATLACTGG